MTPTEVALAEAENESWAETYSACREQIERLRSVPNGPEIVKMLREFYTNGWLGGYRCGLEHPKT